MNLTPSKIEFSDHEHRDIRRDVEQAKTYDGLTEAEVGRQSDVSPSTLNAYLKGSYKGDNNSPAAQLHKWLQARRLALETRSTRPEHPPFQPLRQSQTIINLLSYARETGRIVVIAGSPGVCKTASARQFASDTPRTWLATMDDTTAGVSPMLTEILSAMGEPDAKGTPRALSRRVSDKAEEAKSLIIIDEANHLTDKAIDQLRAINDRA
ncbi:MAG TPA: AAA family ATPase, partial [Caulobacteraceae bacterium]|nr:AAA family ATPase [Caulobacteraceae bacterium]